MQDSYVGDIGDYGKYGLLRKFFDYKIALAVNWYKVCSSLPQKQNDGKYTDYLLNPGLYMHYDSELFDALKSIVYKEKLRKIERIESSGLLNAIFFSQEISDNRKLWHSLALEKTKSADVVFLDPDNGLETEKMHICGGATEKHVKWTELKDYYSRGQSVILYQHRPQMTKKETCIKNILDFNRQYLHSDNVFILEFPKFTNRFYFFFARKEHSCHIKEICNCMNSEWQGFCKQIDIESF